MPSEVANMDVYDFTLNILVAEVGINEEKRQSERATKQAKMKSRKF
jgi:hypothetical protein